MKYKKLTAEKVKQIKTMLKSTPVKRVSEIMKVSNTTIWSIQRGRYDGKVVEERPRDGFFNVDQHWDWIVGGNHEMKLGTHILI